MNVENMSLWAIVVTNLGLIASLIFVGGKGIWWLSKLDSRVTKNSGDVKAAHVKIRDLEHRERERAENAI